MLCEEGWADKFASCVFLITSNPVFKEQIKGIIVRIGRAVKVISCGIYRGKFIDNRERVVLHCI
jgi:hypothetical protein